MFRTSTFVALLTLVFSTMFVGCTPQDFYGTWEWKDSGGTVRVALKAGGNLDGFTETLVRNEDVGSWMFANNRLSLTIIDNGSAFPYHFDVISGSPADGLMNCEGGVWQLLTRPLSELEGVWIGSNRTTVAQPFDGTFTLSFTEYQFKESRTPRGGTAEDLLAGTFTIDPRQQPKTMDITTSSVHLSSIYRIDGDILYWAPSTTPNALYPAENQLDPAVSSYVLVLTKAK